MSQYVLIAGAVSVILAQILTAVATIIAAVKGNQSKDTTEKGALRAAAGFLGVSILFAFICLISGIILAGTKGCSKKNRIIFLFFFILLIISYVIALVIIVIYRNKLTKAGDTAGARDLNSAFILPLVALGLYFLGFILIYFVLGRRLKSIGKVCARIRKEERQIKQKEQQARQIQQVEQNARNARRARQDS